MWKAIIMETKGCNTGEKGENVFIKGCKIMYSSSVNVDSDVAHPYCGTNDWGNGDNLYLNLFNLCVYAAIYHPMQFLRQSLILRLSK